MCFKTFLFHCLQFLYMDCFLISWCLILFSCCFMQLSFCLLPIIFPWKLFYFSCCNGFEHILGKWHAHSLSLQIIQNWNINAFRYCYVQNILFGSFGSFECFWRKSFGEGTWIFAGPMVFHWDLLCCIVRFTCGFNFDTYL